MVKKGKYVSIELNGTDIFVEAVDGMIQISIDGEYISELKIHELQSIIQALNDLTVK